MPKPSRLMVDGHTHPAICVSSTLMSLRRREIPWVFWESQEFDRAVPKQQSAYRWFLSPLKGGQSRTTNLILTVFVFCPLSHYSNRTTNLICPAFCHPFRQGTIPESLGNLVKLKELILSNNKFSGQLFTCFWNGRSRTTNLIVAAFCLLLPQGASLSPWETSGIWRSYTCKAISLQVIFYSFWE